ncbi:MAG: glycoside hydrolase family 13 protein, partial [Planctomycetota bacterium]
LDPDPPPNQTGVQLIESPDGFQGFNQCLLLMPENTPSMKKPPVLPYSFTTDMKSFRWLEDPPRCLLSLAPEFGKTVLLWADGRAYPLRLKFSGSLKKNLGFELAPIPQGKAYFQIGEWFLSPAGLSRQLGSERFEFPSQTEGLDGVRASSHQHQGKIVYQIFPDRFCKAQIRSRSDERPWGEKPRDSWDFFGGDLDGILQKLDYLHSLGVELLYLNPIFLADTNHRYNTSDYFQIDPRLGTLEDFQDLVRESRKRGIEVILDGVFNHTGENFFAFQDLLQYQEKSPYREWYYVLNFPLKEKDKINYEGWWGIGSLPKLNIQHEEVRHYVYQVARYWAKQGIAGLRLDVPNEWRGDYWPEFRNTLLAEFPQFFLIGEIWDRAEDWLYGNRFDGVTHYPLRHWILDVIQEKPKAISQLKENVQEFDFYYGSWSRNTNWTVLSSHDTPRFLTAVQHQEQKLKLGALLQYGLPGMPVLYYGDEAGLSGGIDPDCRRCYPWDRPNQKLIHYYQQLGQYRKWRLSLKKGD